MTGALRLESDSLILYFDSVVKYFLDVNCLDGTGCGQGANQ